ncbi:hypothetical protein HY604_00620 [Candidatus Peregrinibacteria bacterium]|nr:hypothetical protein [Candidatus Peregrinibacteria bacterium]
MKKKKTIAFLYNVFKEIPDIERPETFLQADFDSEETISAIIKNLENCGYDVIPIEGNEDAYRKLFHHREHIDLAFNYAEGLHGRDRELHIPAMLEMLKIPYTGCPPLSQGIVFNKARTKEILLMNNVPTLPFFVFKTGEDAEFLAFDLKFPLIVKPIAQGQSAGITKHSVVYDEECLRRQVDFVLTTFSQAALVEPFLDGREFSVGMLGNPPAVLSIVELNHGILPEKYPNFASVEVKFATDESETSGFLTCPAEIDENLKMKIENMCLAAWHALGIVDWCRVDIRCDSYGNPFILEINSPASIEPPETVTGYCTFPLSAEKSGISYTELLHKIINTSFKRYENKN